MTNYQAPRRTPRQRAIFKLRADRAMRRIKQKWAHKFRKLMIDRERYWNARRLMRTDSDLTLGDARVRAFLDELRRL